MATFVEADAYPGYFTSYAYSRPGTVKDNIHYMDTVPTLKSRCL